MKLSNLPGSGRGWRRALGGFAMLGLAAGGPVAAWAAQTAPSLGTTQAVAAPHWSFQPVVRPAVPLPDPGRSQWAHPIDRFIAARLARNKLALSREADRRTLVRRVYFDLTGLPPSPEDVRSFISDRSPHAYERLVDKLLASPHYGERWGRHWLDGVRFAETTGFEVNTPRPNAWTYRDYVIRALNEDKPYDQFIREQIAGDVLGEDAATGFLVAGPDDKVKSPDPVLTSNQRADELHDMVSTTGGAFLGLTIGCARCHNHKFDPIPQTDYYAIKAVFEGVQHGDRKARPPEDPAREQQLALDRARLQEIDAALARFEARAFTGRCLVIDEEAAGTNGVGPQAVELVPRTARGEYPPGAGRGERDDAGGIGRSANFTPGYLAWNKAANRDVFAYRPRAAGRFRILLSWGCGWNTHATDARYLIDRDGDLATTADQVPLARVNQQQFADGTGTVPNRPLWSGFLDAGLHELDAASCIVLRGGDSDRYVSADVVALLEEASPGVLLRAPVRANENVERFAPVAARRLRFSITRTSSGSEPCLDELEVYSAETRPRNVALASAGARARASGVYPNSDLHRLEHLNDGRHGNSHSWISNEPGRGWVELQFPEAILIDRVVWGRDRERAYSDRVPTEYRIEVAIGPEDTNDTNDTNGWRLVASSVDRQPHAPGRKVAPALSVAGLNPSDLAEANRLLAEREERESRLAQAGTGGTMVYGGTFNPTPGPTYRLHRGDPMMKREVIAPGALGLFPARFDLSGAAAGLPSGGLRGVASAALNENQRRRLALANWITDPSNPLTARVMVNRLWQYHFGEGLVSTPSDFGANGARPTHPELLDWLAAELMQPTAGSGADAAGASHRDGAAAAPWSLKHLHRLIVTSATYRQSSEARPEGIAADAGSRLLWRFPPRRLEAEAIRDLMLSVSGRLDLRMGGPGFSFFAPNDNYVRVYAPRAEFGPDAWRRMVYGTVVRQRPDGVFGVFDCPDGGQIAPKRNRSTTPLQALNLLNSAFVMQQAEFFAERLQREVPGGLKAQVRRAFELALQREPDRRELAAALAFARERGLPLFSRALLNANEFVYLF